MPADLSSLWVSLKTAIVATLLASFLGMADGRWMMDYRGRANGWRVWRNADGGQQHSRRYPSD